MARRNSIVDEQWCEWFDMWCGLKKRMDKEIIDENGGITKDSWEQLCKQKYATAAQQELYETMLHDESTWDESVRQVMYFVAGWIFQDGQYVNTFLRASCVVDDEYLTNMKAFDAFMKFCRRHRVICEEDSRISDEKRNSLYERFLRETPAMFDDWLRLSVGYQAATKKLPLAIKEMSPEALQHLHTDPHKGYSIFLYPQEAQNDSYSFPGHWLIQDCCWRTRLYPTSLSPLGMIAVDRQRNLQSVSLKEIEKIVAEDGSVLYHAI